MTGFIAVWVLVISFATDGGVAAIPYPNEAECRRAAEMLRGRGAFGGSGGVCIPGYAPVSK